MKCSIYICVQFHVLQVDAGYNPDTGCYQIITYDSYNKYEQVFISYGAHDNRFLLLEYGFCISGNTNNFVNFTIGEASIVILR